MDLRLSIYYNKTVFNFTSVAMDTAERSPKGHKDYSLILIDFSDWCTLGDGSMMQGREIS